MVIRKATVKDSELIAKINNLSDDPLDKILKNNEADIFLFDNKGVVALKKSFSGHNNCELYLLTVDKNNSRKGIATKLVNYIENYAKKLNFRGIYLYTHPIHKPAMKLYKKLRYKKINEFKNYYGNGDKAILFGKELK